MHRAFLPLLLVAPCLLLGCGPPPLHPVAGTVTIAGKPADNVRVYFWPESGASTQGTRLGMAITSADGRFEIASGSGAPGLEAGSYRVTFSRPLARGTSLPAADRPEGAVESIPAPYCDHTTPGNSPIAVRVVAASDFQLAIP